MIATPPIEFVAPLVLASAVTLAILKIDEPKLSQKDLMDPGGWQYADEWLPGAVRGKRFLPSRRSDTCVETSERGKWRTMKRHGSIQSVTLWDPEKDEAIHTTAGNEYIKVMASAHLALTMNEGENNEKTLLYLGLGAGTLPMLINEPAFAVELDPDVMELAEEYCGFDPSLVSVVKGNALYFDSYFDVSQYDAIFVDVFGADNNVPPSFCKPKFIQHMHDFLSPTGTVIANFHRGTASEDERLQEAVKVYEEVFGSSCSVPVRYQGNTILCASKHASIGERMKRIDEEKLNLSADERGWLFDPSVRLKGIRSSSQSWWIR